jgi:hypothetical protein
VKATLVPAQPQHIAAVAARARQADIDVLWAQARSTPARCLVLGLQRARVAYTALIGDAPVAMFGVTPDGPSEGVPWLVGTTALSSPAVQRELLRLSRPMVDGWMAEFALLFNSVDDRNTSAKRWLRWLGFTLGDPVPTGCDGELFCPFYRVRHE